MAEQGKSVLISNAYNINTDCDWLLIAKDAGCWVFSKAASNTWTLIWVNSIDTAAQLYPGFSVYEATFTLGNFRILDLGQYDPRFATDNGLATSVLTNPAAGTTARHEADAVIEWTFEHQAGASTHSRVRWADAANHWRITAELTTGNCYLVEVVNNVATVRGSANGAFTAGANHRVVVILDGNTYHVYVDNVLKITYTDPSHYHIDATSWTGGGSNISSLITWPRHITLPGGI